MNDPGLDSGVKELAETQKEASASSTTRPKSSQTGGGQTAGEGGFLSPNYQSRHSRTASNTTNSSRGSTQSGVSRKSLPKPNRRSLFWERFSHDSREGDEDAEDTRRRAKNSLENGSVNSRSPIRQPQSFTGEEGGDEEKDIKELNEMSKKGQQDEQVPGMYFLLSTVFPLMAATLGPVTNVMSICALVVPWRRLIPPGQPVESAYKVPDPAWCLAINAISLACGFAANVILLLNLARRIQSINLQPLIIALWYTASILLTTLLAVFSKHLYKKPAENYIWSQAFYYGIIAAVLYFVIATLLVGNYIGVIMKKYARQFTLTIAQRTLMLQTLSLMCWLCLGAGVFSKLEGWAYLDGIYFCDTTFLVVGLGDYTLTTNAGRALLFPYAAIGIVMIGLVVSSIRSLLLERGKRKVKRRLLEKQREDFLDGDQNGNGSDSKNEKERFELMRKAQDRADQKRKWVSLGISVVFFLIFWMLGAFVFMETEEAQQWNYFQSLYFAFTTILTIGYGDFSPVSEAGKPFFVIWSLLAVPVVTILVSNLGDTIIALIKNLTLWLGEWTVLPEEKLSELGGRNRWLQTEPQRLKHQRLKRAETIKQEREQEAKATDPEIPMDADDSDDKKRLGEIGADLMHREEKEEEEEENHDPMLAIHHKLAFAVQKLLPDLASKESKQYSYEEWNEYLELLYPSDDEPEEYQAPRDFTQKSSGKRDWLSEDSPLMSRQSETEWLLTKLCSRLEECLRDQKNSRRRREDKGKNRKESSDTGHGSHMRRRS